MRRWIDKYLNEIVGLAVMLLMVVALVHAETVVRPAAGDSADSGFTTVARDRAPSR